MSWSRGLAASPGASASANASATLKQHGVSLIDEHQAQQVGATDVQLADVILVMNEEQKQMLLNVSSEDVQERTRFLLSFAGKGAEDIQDPCGMAQAAYDECFAQMKPALQTLAATLTGTPSRRRRYASNPSSRVASPVGSRPPSAVAATKSEGALADTKGSVC
eukprot:CAMPEP_0119308486 /NCGR_PEP_ID=MMETSP1333-20130426/11198_1 /TAXON_ID=418940 /ORGANISM="Scyphosphaera apsteinii, Strain RCC1455" /LENGTH=163 /DNA_ID=CAMNT_0007312261 /DNA_START=292 /DNA_END=783 /DNA_ORIENTATION=+